MIQVIKITPIPQNDPIFTCSSFVGFGALDRKKRQDQQSQQSSGESDSGHMFHRKHISPVERSLEVANMTW